LKKSGQQNETLAQARASGPRTPNSDGLDHGRHRAFQNRRSKPQMKKMILITLAALAAAAIASAQDVNYNFDATAKFSDFKTYKWVEIPGGVKLDDLIARQLDSALQGELTKKGLSKVDSDTADLYIGYQVAVNQERSISAYGMGGGWRMGGGMATAQTSTLQIGTLDLDMYNPVTKELIWRGAATKTIDTGAKPEKRADNIQKGAAKLLKNYPPAAKKK
jgi:hypothetical protein